MVFFRGQDITPEQEKDLVDALGKVSPGPTLLTPVHWQTPVVHPSYSSYHRGYIPQG